MAIKYHGKMGKSEQQNNILHNTAHKYKYIISELKNISFVKEYVGILSFGKRMYYTCSSTETRQQDSPCWEFM